MIAKRFERKEELYLGPKRRRQVIELESENEYRVTTLVTCAGEEPEVFEEAMRVIAQQRGLLEHKILIMMDGIDDPDNPGDRDAQNLSIAQKYGDKVYVTNVRDKRINLKNLVQFARDEGMLRERLAFMDSDTICDHEWVMAFLAYELSDSTVGGATTAQRCLRTDTIPERIGDWLENARLKASMAAASLYGQLVCLPGRLYMARTDAVANRIINELSEEVWRGRFKPTWRFPFFESWEVKTKAGDDRRTTEYIIEAGLRTVLVLPAGVKTLVPSGWSKMWRTWRRWGTSSQGYFYQSYFGPQWRIWWKKWFILYHQVSDIALTHIAPFLVMAWVVALFTSNEELLLPLTTVILMSVIGVLATFGWRQIAHLNENKRDWLMLPVFVVVVTLAQFIRLLAHYTPWRIGTWGTRVGVDDAVYEPYVQEYVTDA